jgi:hypothetical protein
MYQNQFQITFISPVASGGALTLGLAFSHGIRETTV